MHFINYKFEVLVLYWTTSMLYYFILPNHWNSKAKYCLQPYDMSKNKSVTFKTFTFYFLHGQKKRFIIVIMIFMHGVLLLLLIMFTFFLSF